MIILSIDSGCKNNAVVKMKIEENKIEVIQTDLFDFCKKKKVKECSFESIIKNLINDFDNYDVSDVDVVLIENIPSRLNMTTKSISIATYTHLLSKGLEVKLVSPSRKLSKEQNKLTYRERKKEGIKKGLSLLNDEDKENIIKKYKKTDDIIDCIIQAYEWNKKK